MTLKGRYGHHINVVLLVLVSVVVFVSCLDSYFFIVDDLSDLTQGRTGDIAGVLFRNAHGGAHGGNYRPIEPLSHFLDVQLSGPDNPAARRVTNLIVHILNVILVYALVLQLSPVKLIGFGAAVLFAVHPLHAQALPPLAWISGRTELFVTLFYLLSLLLFMRAMTRRSMVLYGLSLLSFGLALLSKEMAITLPLAILAYWIIGPHRASGETWLSGKREACIGRTLLLLGISAILAGVVLSPSVIQQYLSSDGVLEKATLRNVGYLRRLALLVGVGTTLYVLLLGRAPSRLRTTVKLVSPYFVMLGVYFIVRTWVLGNLGGLYESEVGNVGLQIGLDAFMRDVYALAGLVWPVGFGYNIAVFTLQIEHPLVFYGLSIAASVALGLILLISIRKSPTAALGFVWIFIMLMPVHNILIPSWRFQARYLYLPAVGLCICLSVFLNRFSQDRKQWRRVLFPGALASLIMLSAGAIIKHNAALAKSGEITRELMKSIESSQRDISAAGDLMYVTFPLSAGETRYVSINAYMPEILGASGARRDVPYHFLLYVMDGEQSTVAVTRQRDGTFMADIMGRVNCFWMPEEPNALERQIKEIYRLQPDDRMLQPLPAQGTVETHEASITVVEVDTIARRTRVKIDLKDSKAGRRWFVYDNGGFRSLDPP